MVGHMAPDDKKDGRKDPIDEHLKRVYDEVLQEDVPDRFTDLLNQLRQQDQSKSGGKA